MKTNSLTQWLTALCSLVLAAHGRQTGELFDVKDTLEIFQGQNKVQTFELYQFPYLELVINLLVHDISILRM